MIKHPCGTEWKYMGRIICTKITLPLWPALLLLLLPLSLFLLLPVLLLLLLLLSLLHCDTFVTWTYTHICLAISPNVCVYIYAYAICLPHELCVRTENEVFMKMFTIRKLTAFIICIRWMNVFEWTRARLSVCYHQYSHIACIARIRALA